MTAEEIDAVTVRGCAMAESMAEVAALAWRTAALIDAVAACASRIAADRLLIVVFPDASTMFASIAAVALRAVDIALERLDVAEWSARIADATDAVAVFAAMMADDRLVDAVFASRTAAVRLAVAVLLTEIAEFTDAVAVRAALIAEETDALAVCAARIAALADAVAV